METNTENNLSEATSQKQTPTKVWLWLLPVLAVCALSFCAVAAGLFFWQRSSSQPVEESAAIIEPSLPTENDLVQESAAIIEPSSPTESDAISTAPTTPTVAPSGLTSLPVEATTEAAPFSCPDSDVAIESAITTPILSPISFATRQGSDGWPLDTSLQFTTAVTKVLATFSYAGLENGLTWERVWYFGEQELSRGSGVWDAGPQGMLTVQVMAGAGGFVPGVYKLNLYVEGQLLGQGTFYMVKPDLPTQRPIQVAYTNWDGQAHQLHLLDLTTGQTETLATAARGPAWSADASGLLFYSEDENAAGLHVFNMGQRKAYALNQEFFFQSIAWSPHRAHVAAAKDDKLVLWDLGQNQAYSGPVGTNPAWSPEGQRLAYRSCTQAGWNISTIQVISSTFHLATIRQLTQGDDSQPAWSWDGQRLAFVRRDGDNQDIYVMNGDGSNLTRLTDQPAADVSPAWTPDNRLIFRSQRNEQWGLYSMAADGSNQQLLLATPAQAGWQPDQLAVSTNVLLAPPEPAKSQPEIPAGHGLLAISNQQNTDEMTFTIDNKEHKIGPYQIRTVPLKPGRYTWTASWPGKNSRTGFADIGLGQVAYPVVER